MSLNVKATSSALKALPSLHFTSSRRVKVQLSPSLAAAQDFARSAAAVRSLPGFVRPSKRTRLTKMDSTKALGCHGFIVGSAAMGIVTVPPVCAAGALVGGA